MKVLNFLIKSKIYIAFGAVMLSVSTQIQLGNPPQISFYLVLIFIATLLIYNLNRVIDFIDEKNIMKNKISIYLLLLVITGLLIFYLQKLYAQKFTMLIVIPTIFASLFYTVPIFKTSRINFTLRGIPYLKLFLISAVWTCTTVLIPAFYSYDTNTNNKIWFLFLERFLFILAITLLFDVRDIDLDKKNGIKTVPILIGNKKSTQISIIALSFLIVIRGINCLNDSNWQLLLVLWISYFSTIYFLNSKNLKRLPLYYDGILDGTMILQGILVAVSYFLF